MHHKHLDRHDGESFGMLWVPKKYWDKVREDKRRNANNFVTNSHSTSVKV
jgi:beta-carotene 3-hydroxylase